ncbi:hypothetical protein CGLO_15272 [Colletotrichum gloeosporioides Cg-14]|uniref:Uncharacterized protein n=1 Tax=Colletotrichum gloeosporioides (strain Cg-14) TaxID=1237896 RepID=T0JRC1_COLGC|nr:hypothetical protein CGLO_15272 [Colletotrichum gloeosporioides Cg-14]
MEDPLSGWVSEDETYLVILLHRRGGYWLWRKPSEAYSRSCIRER